MYVERLGRQAEPKQRSCLDLRNEKMTTLHIRCRPKEEQWGSTKRGEGRKAFTHVLTLKEILIRRQRNIWDVDYLPLLLLVEVCWICASSHPLVTCLYGTVSSNERKAPNKAAP
jgi:hypothetical protein